jgi:hypothetical protein
MPTASETAPHDLPSGSIPANSLAAIQARIAAGRVPWLGPLLLVTARSFLLLASQGLVALILLGQSRPHPWRGAGDWWGVYGTLVDIGCLVCLRYFTRREGIRLRDLIGPIRLRFGRDLWLGLGYYLLIFPFFLGASYLARMLLFGSANATLAGYLLQFHSLPFWATAYSLTVWWIVWSPTEETTYQAYAMPRLQALTGRTWIAFPIVLFWWTAQHCALPFIPDGRYLLFRFLAFLPGVAMLMLIYLRTRRLAPLIVAHWPMDIAAAAMTAIFSSRVHS